MTKTVILFLWRQPYQNTYGCRYQRTIYGSLTKRYEWPSRRGESRKILLGLVVLASEFRILHVRNGVVRFSMSKGFTSVGVTQIGDRRPILLTLRHSCDAVYILMSSAIFSKVERKRRRASLGVVTIAQLEKPTPKPS